MVPILSKKKKNIEKIVNITEGSDDTNKQLFIGYLPRKCYYRKFFCYIKWNKIDISLFMVGVQSYFKNVSHKICQYILSTFLW